MARSLTLALVVEGHSDAAALPALVRRLLTKAAQEFEDPPMLVDEVQVLIDQDKAAEPLATRIGRRLRDEQGWNLAVLHADADDRTPDQARRERVDPVRRAIEPDLGSNQRLVGLIPVRMTEAWLLCDPDAFRVALGSTLSDEALGIPAEPEAVLAPKAALRAAIDRARGGRRARRSLAGPDYTARIAEELDLDRLLRLRSARSFRDEAQAALVDLGFR